MTVYQLAQAVITKYYHPAPLNYQQLFSHSLGGRKFQLTVEMVCGEAFQIDLQMPTTLLLHLHKTIYQCTTMEEGKD